ncbi:glycosyltransferase [uncultured Ferrovibrio sp.]|jgi:glycosyltransferase involved in cell wall biosynthesis|uniref:glycosyltransferase n=1 Tax=uncultured Ferrovibrio sp. TaxID=1576913 RepID=UPI002623D285|nr:glycosyltransferase [uncultured Ferrovibrio sp.]
MTIKILHVITGLGTGGAERMLQKLVCDLRARGHENHIVSLTSIGPIGRQLMKVGFKVDALGMTSVLHLPAAITRLGRILRQTKPDILQTWLYHADLTGCLAHWWSRSPATLIWNLRCSDMELGNYALSTRLARRMAIWLSHRPWAMITNSVAGQRHHAALGYRPPRWEYIPNGFDLSIYRPMPGSRTIQDEIGLPSDAFLVGMVARHDPMKDHEAFLLMAKLVLTKRPQTHFVLIGKGCTIETPIFAKAAEQLKGHLHLLGERSDIDRLLPSLDLFVLSSAYGEGFPNVLGEALACGLPCIATDVGDTAAILGDCGICVPPRDPARLADAVLTLIDAPPSTLQELRQKARRRAEDHFALEAVGDRYCRLYQEAIGDTFQQPPPFGANPSPGGGL